MACGACSSLNLVNQLIVVVADVVGALLAVNDFEAAQIMCLLAIHRRMQRFQMVAIALNPRKR